VQSDLRTMDTGNNGIYTAPSVLPTATTPAGSTTTAPTTVLPSHVEECCSQNAAVAQITLVSATNNSINFQGIFPPPSRRAALCRRST